MDLITGVILCIIIIVLILFIILFSTGVIRGERGATGPTGSQGIPGTAVNTGATGTRGPTGPQGPMGHLGFMGPTGSRGPTGPINHGKTSNLITFNSGTALMNNHFQFFGYQTLNESAAQIVMNKKGVISDLFVSVSQPGQAEFILRVNGQDTPLKITLMDHYAHNNNDLCVYPNDKISILFRGSSMAIATITFTIT